jgi:hypothetical protein
MSSTQRTASIPDVDRALEPSSEPDLSDDHRSQTRSGETQDEYAGAGMHLSRRSRRIGTDQVVHDGQGVAPQLALALRRYWAPTGSPCRLLARACSIVPA